MSLDHAIDPVIDSQRPNHQQSPSFERPTSLPGTVYESVRQTVLVGLTDHAGIPIAEPSVRISGNCAIDTSIILSDWGNDTTTYFDDEYHAINISRLHTADNDSISHTSGAQSRFNDIEEYGGDHQMDAGENQSTTKCATLSCDSTIPPPTYVPIRLDPPQPRSNSGLDYMNDIEAIGAAPSRSPVANFQVEVFDTSSVSCSKAYATGGAANVDLDCRPMIPQANHKSRLGGGEEAWLRNSEMPKGYTKSLSPYRDGVQPTQLPFLMEAVVQLSADADSTVPGRPVERLEKHVDTIIGSPPPSKAQRILKPLLPQIPNTEPPHTPALPIYGTHPRQHNWLTPPSSYQSSLHVDTTEEVAFSSNCSQSPTSPNISPTAVHAVLSLKTPIGTPLLDLRKDQLDRIPFRPIYGYRTQVCEYATPPSTSRAMPVTGLTHTPNVNDLGFFPSDIANTSPTPTNVSYLSPGDGPAPPTSESIQCEICQKPFHGKRATVFRSLKRHKETEHGGKAYECIHCGERLSRSDYRARHLQSKKHDFQLPPTPKSRKRDPTLEKFLQSSFRKVTTGRVEV